MKITRDDLLQGIELCHEIEKVWKDNYTVSQKNNRQRRIRELRKLLEGLLQVDSTVVNVAKMCCDFNEDD